MFHTNVHFFDYCVTTQETNSMNWYNTNQCQQLSTAWFERFDLSLTAYVLRNANTPFSLWSLHDQYHESILVRVIEYGLKPHPHLYANAEWNIWKWEKCWCECVAKAVRTAFICAANVQWTAKQYLFGVVISKKNTFAMLGIRLTRRTPNKPLFGICLGSLQSCMPNSCSCTDVDIPLQKYCNSWSTHRTEPVVTAIELS